MLGCSTPFAGSRDLAIVDLQTRQQLPEIGDIHSGPLRIAVGAVLSAEGTIEAYADLAEYMGELLDRPVEIVQRRTYAEVNDLVEAGEVDLAFVCTSAYVTGHAAGYMDLLVVPEIDGKTTYHSSIIVPGGSAANSIADLRGTRFAFTDPMSLTGRVYATSAVLALGESPETFFGQTVFTYSHDRAIAAVAAGVVDGAGVDNLVLDHLIAADPSLVNRVRIIDVSPEFGIPPVVVPSNTPAAVRALFEELLLGLSSDVDGPSILASLGVDRFVTVTDEVYDDVRDLVKEYPTQP